MQFPGDRVIEITSDDGLVDACDSQPCSPLAVINRFLTRRIHGAVVAATIAATVTAGACVYRVISTV